ncbi:MAG TPA: Ala-tRNA(Pro) hydrolase [Gammaproteobacteria bacterium]|jgi:misacylated tRNA(Ala) deacylase|nr:Ala-tRNA(Pro) hydrolase [Acidiferrobacteraceae bacterium]MDP6552445.1 alanyl-tRNA editing protein [Arenicellales bacterium]MDP6792098.1 alanyl-tRNA editing protein [Arenicellales bacterium]MDP6918259.1 alanyl-tRNA editing protein [Arenicellales bacterium]HCX86683.1 Ala-tRNA(Pro) hydrolase [Gammaproteobacteria bacterium]|tara:strand:+ start:17547 stop:18257 length:711 start_codon:yes stop_codon:yes gene_type:complete
MSGTEKLYQDDAYLRECTAKVLAVTGQAVILDRSVFYCQGGGQPGDTGEFILSDGRMVKVTDTVAQAETGEQLHLIAEGETLPEVGEEVLARINWERRYRFMRMHSCMHMLCAVIDAPVTGGSVSDGRARLDFDLPDPVDKTQVTEALNGMIRRDRPRHLRWITDAELESQPELVRTMSVSPPSGQGRVRLVEFEGIDLQPCGGTHVARSGEIGDVRVAKIEKKGKQNRRVIVEFA